MVPAVFKPRIFRYFVPFGMKESASPGFQTMKEADKFYLKQDEPVRSCFLALRDIILSQDKEVTHEWKYGMPFFCCKGKMFCYLWFHKKYGKPYIGMVEGKLFDHPDLIQEKRSRMKIMLLDPEEDLPIGALKPILKKAIDHCKTKRK